jgi:DNA modification methylase
MTNLVINSPTAKYSTGSLFDDDINNITETNYTSELRNGYDLNIAPLDATFRDSSRAPMHSWFPYLEGYSPRFVERVMHEYLDKSKRIIEPFAGSGTTPIVLGQAGIECAYSEANPAMAFIVQTKVSILKLSLMQRKILSEKIHWLLHQFTERVGAASPCEKLRNSFTGTFDQSVFFDASILEIILRLRTVNDEIKAEDSMLGNCLTLAILSSLIPSSRLKRAGDLRFKTPKELLSGTPNPIDVVTQRLGVQATDLVLVSELRAQTYFAGDTAVSLKDSLEGDWDGVITSPPYLNGTNYIRNARLELWYLRHLVTKADLRRLRDKVITSGINDVDSQTDWRPVTEGIRRVVCELQEKSYDDRIAKMVGGYFRDMASVFSSLIDCTRPGARLCVDIGDSIYAGVHVPTDDLLVEVAESLGLRTLERIYLRKRISKGGQSVRQQLLVFEKSER